jgi:glycine dehydrogenase subunit 1
MALLGPEGLRELGETVMYKAHYAMKLLSGLEGIKTPIFESTHFKEFTVNFDKTGMSVDQINERLLKHHIHGGKSISEDFPELGQTALYCTTEIHSKQEIDQLAAVLGRILKEE